MEMTTRGLWTMVHGMGFGALYLLACSFAFVELYRRYRPSPWLRFELTTKCFSGDGSVAWRWLRGSRC